jgi:hypothetical protein
MESPEIVIESLEPMLNSREKNPERNPTSRSIAITPKKDPASLM